MQDLLTVVARSAAVPTSRSGWISSGRAARGRWPPPPEQAGSAIDRLAIATGHFRFANITSIDDPDFLPGAAKYGDLEALLALSAPNDLWIGGESPNRMTLPIAAYRAVGEEKRLTIDSGPSDAAETRAVEWLLR